MFRFRSQLAAVTLAASLAAAVAVVPANAQHQEGLVNISVGDVTILEDVRIDAALAVAANLCNVGVNVLAQQFRQAQQAQCSSNQGLAVVQ